MIRPATVVVLMMTVQVLVVCDAAVMEKKKKITPLVQDIGVSVASAVATVPTLILMLRAYDEDLTFLVGSFIVQTFFLGLYLMSLAANIWAFRSKRRSTPSPTEGDNSDD
jgi:hypothetical protein